MPSPSPRIRTAQGRIALAVGVAWVAAVLAPPAVSGEWFGDLYRGAAFTQRHEVTLESPAGDQLLSDIGFNRSAVFGGGGGYWFDCVGGGLDISHFRPDTVPSSVKRLDLYVTPISGLFMVRWSLMADADNPHGRLQPYLALGLSVAYIEGKDTTNFVPNSQYAAGFFVGGQGSAGVAWQLQRNIALFGEYRFTHFSPDPVQSEHAADGSRYLLRDVRHLSPLLSRSRHGLGFIRQAWRRAASLATGDRRESYTPAGLIVSRSRVDASAESCLSRM
jgi:opacity protein-like surface antigen